MTRLLSSRFVYALTLLFLASSGHSQVANDLESLVWKAVDERDTRQFETLLQELVEHPEAHWMRVFTILSRGRAYPAAAAIWDEERDPAHYRAWWEKLALTSKTIDVRVIERPEFWYTVGVTVCATGETVAGVSGSVLHGEPCVLARLCRRSLAQPFTWRGGIADEACVAPADDRGNPGTVRDRERPGRPGTSLSRRSQPRVRGRFFALWKRGLVSSVPPSRSLCRCDPCCRVLQSRVAHGVGCERALDSRSGGLGRGPGASGGERVHAQDGTAAGQGGSSGHCDARDERACRGRAFW